MKKISVFLMNIILVPLFSVAYADNSNHYATEQSTLNQIYNNVGDSATNTTPPTYAEAGVASVESHFSGAFARNSDSTTAVLVPPPVVATTPKQTTTTSVTPPTQTTSTVATGFGN